MPGPRHPWRWWLLVGLWLLASCSAPPVEPPTTSQPLKGQPLHRIWQQGKKAWLALGASLGQLPASAFPLTLSVAALAPEGKLPRATTPAPTATHIKIAARAAQGDAPIALPQLAQEAALALRNQQGQLLDWVTWSHFPDDTTLVRTNGRERFCQGLDAADTDKSPCQPHHRRGDDIHRLRHIRSPEEFDGLTRLYGDNGLQIKVVKFVVDKRHDDMPHFFTSREWSLHFTFVWEVLRQQRRLDTCIGEDYKIFWREYQAFNEQNVRAFSDRPYVMGSVVYYPGAKLYAVEFATGYNNPGADMVLGYQRVRRLFDRRIDLRFRPKSVQQLETLRAAPGGDDVPTWPQDAPYKGETLQLLSPGVAFGVLKAYSSKELATASLGVQVIALLKDVPNDINFVGGIVSSQFQSPLSHINVLSRNRGTPHLVFKGALSDSKIAPLIGKLVRLEVTTQGYRLDAASRKDAEAFWETQRGKRTPFVPKRDLSSNALVDLSRVDHTASARIGAKAANLAELARIRLLPTLQAEIKPACQALADQNGNAAIPVPKKPFAIPFYWYVDHLKRAQIDALIETLHEGDRLRSDGDYRRQQLALLQRKIMETPVSPTLLAALRKQITARYGDVKVRFRSSTNAEDLADFNGAGLYTSKSAQLGHETKTIEQALRTVWASIWSDRAWNERDFYRIDHTQVAMGILVHPSFPDEDANGVAVSSNIFYANGSTFDTYIAVQKGERSIVNPEDDATPEQLLVRWSNPLQFLYLSRSSLLPQGSQATVLSQQEATLLGCYMRSIHQHFLPLSARDGKPFAMEAEFKINPPGRQLILKQTRPYIFGEDPTPRASCR